MLIVLLTALLLLVGTVQAAKTKYTFNDVEIDEQVVEIEASVKDTKKSDYSTCSYYSVDYGEYLGYYDADVVAGETAEDVLDFCVAHFEEGTRG